MITYKHLKDIVNLCKKRNKLKHLIKINKTDTDENNEFVTFC